MSKIFTEAFKELDALNEDVFEINDTDGVDRLKAFMDGDAADDTIDIIDPDAETEEELKDDYVGKVILDCVVCHSKIYKDKEDITIEEDSDVVNEGEECPYCYSLDGFKVVGVVAPFKPHDEDDDDDEEEDEEETEVEVKNVSESLKKSLKEGKYRGAKNVRFVGHGEWSDPDLVYKGYTFNYWDIENALWDMFLEDTGHTDSESGVPEVEAEFDEYVRNHVDDYLDDVIYGGYFADGSKSWHDKLESLKIKRSSKKPVTESCEKKPVNEAPMYDLAPATDPRKSFYGKAKVVTDDKGGEQLYSYNTLVAEMKDGKPVVYGTYSMTTLRHIKEWLKGHGFKAENAKQIMADYGADIEESLGDDIGEYQKWVDYDMKRYGKVSDITERRIKKAGLTLVKDQYGDYEVIAHERIHEDVGEENPFAELRSNVIEFPSGDYVYVGYEDGKMFAGSATNVGVIHEVELDYDHDKSVDANLQDLYDAVSEKHPEYFEETEALHEGVEVKADEDTVKVETDEATVTVEKKCDGCEEVIEPVPVDVQHAIADENEVDVEVDDFDEEAFDELGEGYLKKVYENVDSYKTTGVRTTDGKLVLEGVITFASGNKKNTKFVFESKSITKDGKVTFLGENAHICKGKKAFSIVGTLTEGVMKTNKFGYDYTAKNGKGKATRIHGTISSAKK